MQRVTVGHWDISQYYLGQLYTRPPWHYPFVMIACRRARRRFWLWPWLVRLRVVARQDAAIRMAG